MKSAVNQLRSTAQPGNAGTNYLYVGHRHLPLPGIVEMVHGAVAVSDTELITA